MHSTRALYAPRHLRGDPNAASLPILISSLAVSPSTWLLFRGEILPFFPGGRGLRLLTWSKQPLWINKSRQDSFLGRLPLTNLVPPSLKISAISTVIASIVMQVVAARSRVRLFRCATYLNSRRNAIVSLGF